LIFAEHVCKIPKSFPPSVDGLVAWSALFNNSGTFSNYLGKLNLACQLMRLPGDNLSHASVKRAKAAIKKREPAPKSPRFIRAELVARLVKLANEEGDPTSGLFYLFCYTFLLRARSEGLPVEVGTEGEKAKKPDQLYHEGKHSCLRILDRELVLCVARRKNKPHGSTLKGGCWCGRNALSTSLCPVHVLGKEIGRLPPGSRPFAQLYADVTLRELRRRLSVLGVADAESYVLHDFRRGHAEDLRRAGKSLWVILQAGEWGSPAFLAYMDLQS